MTRNSWLWLVVLLMAATLAITFISNPKYPVPRPDSTPKATPFGWTAQLGLVAGDGVQGLQDGPALQARFADPYGVAVDGDGTLYISDGGDNNLIRKFGVGGTITTLAGSVEGFADGVGGTAAF